MCLAIWTAKQSAFCVFKYARAVKQKVWNEAENRERDWGNRFPKSVLYLNIFTVKLTKP